MLRHHALGRGVEPPWESRGAGPSRWGVAKGRGRAARGRGCGGAGRRRAAARVCGPLDARCPARARERLGPGRARGRTGGRTDGLGGEVAAEPAPERRHTAGAGKPQGTAAPPGLRHGARRAGERASVRAPPPRPPRQPRVPSVVARTCASQSVPPSAVAAHLGAARAGRRLRDAGGAGRARAP